ncbi:MAG: protein translocase subunit SecDF [Flavobacteriales bacterium]|nr:protein translocase subunit SecDF [Flavobacteriales bacterium]
MQNKGALWVFSILLALACLWQLSFSLFSNRFEAKVADLAQAHTDSLMAVAANSALDADSVKLAFENRYFQAHGSDEAYPVFGYSYEECKQREMSMGLDLKGGMAVTLEVDIPALVDNLSGNNQDPAFRTAMDNANKRLTSSDKDFISLFEEEFRKVAPQASLAALFSSQDNASIFPRESTNEQIIASLRQQAQIALDNTEKILRNRIDKFGVAQPLIQKQSLSGRIQIELPGVKDKDRVRKVLQSTANLEFWETFDNTDVYMKLSEANDKLAAMLHPEAARLDSVKKAAAKAADTTATDTTATAAIADTLALKNDSLASDSLTDLLATDSLAGDSVLTEAESLAKSPLLNKGRLQLNIMNNQVVRGDVVGYAAVSDTAMVNQLLRMAPPKSPDPSQVMKLAWSSKPVRMSTADGQERDFLSLHALRGPRDGKPKLDGSYITDARQDFDLKGDAEVTMQMNAEGAQKWKLMTGENVGRQIAIVLDNYVVSAPNVLGEIPGGRSSITMGGADDRNKQLEEATDLANVLKAGALPAPARIIDETVVGPSLGAENVDSSLIAFIVSLLGVLLVMWLYYNQAGWVADLALLANVFFLIGTMASLQAVLTLPGIAGIVLTIGMAVDANVLINEKVRDELKKGRMLKSAVDLSYSTEGAMSAILDSNITTFITAIILYFFGSGPIRGFATTLGLGILTSLFTAIFISRLIMDRKLEKNKTVSFWRNWNKNLFDGANFNFMGNRKWFYLFSGLLMAVCIGSMVTRGFNLGVDFSGGRSYVVEFEQPVDVDQVRDAVEAQFVGDNGREYTAWVKTYGGSDRIKITTNFLIDQLDKDADVTAEERLNKGLQQLGNPYQIQESRKVDATISDDIKKGAVTSVTLALIFMFIYIAVRFKKWQYGLGAVASLVHDTIFILGLYSMLWGVVGFSLEIDEAFIAVILTVIGYSINDTVVVFDRIREHVADHKRDPLMKVFNTAINSTLSRTLNTGMCSLLVLLIIFFFGGVSIQGFVFGLFAGVLTGTYSSIFVASALAADLHKEKAPQLAKA